MSQIFNVTNFGAQAGGVSNCTAAVQEAIDAATAQGGGVVVFEPGIYLMGSIFVKNNVELRIDKDVVIQGIEDESAYPDIWTRVAGIEMDWPAALINVCDQKNVKISGSGVVFGSGSHWWNKYWGTDRRGGMRKEYEAQGLRWAVDYDCKRPRLIQVWESEDVKIQDLTLKASPFWTIHVCYSNNITIDGIIITESTGPSSDGIDIDSSSNILIENCDIDCNDDNFCLKSGRDADGMRVNRPTENVTIRNCITRAGHGMFTIGSETSGGIRNIKFQDSKAFGTRNGIRFKSARNRGGVIENIEITNIEMDGVQIPFEFQLNWLPNYSYPTLPEGWEGEIPSHWQTMMEQIQPPERGIPEFKNIDISDVTAKNATTAFLVDGLSEKPIHHVKFEDINIVAKEAGIIKNAEQWMLENFQLKVIDDQSLKMEGCVGVDLPTISKI